MAFTFPICTFVGDHGRVGPSWALSRKTCQDSRERPEASIGWRSDLSISRILWWRGNGSPQVADVRSDAHATLNYQELLLANELHAKEYAEKPESRHRSPRQRKNESKMPMVPLAKTQPRFGNGRMVSDKIALEEPSTMKNTILETSSLRSWHSPPRGPRTPTWLQLTALLSA